MNTENLRNSLVETTLAAGRAGDLTDRLATLLSINAPIVLTTSFGLEDQVLTHAAVGAMHRTGRTIRFATLDTGRLFPETYDVWARTESRYGIRIGCFSPEAVAVADLVAAQGINGFRDAVENRRACCGVRKVIPLRRALAGADIWISGLRADQSGARSGISFGEWDETFGIVKAYPLADWTRDDAAGYARANKVPLNPLHAGGFLSIGCAPCTRAVEPGEPERAGRWWWENESHKECGLHRRPQRAGISLNDPAVSEFVVQEA